VSFLSSNGLYSLGGTVSIQVTYSENVLVAGGTPTLLLETGSTDRSAVYASGSGTPTLTFTYTVQSGDMSADLDTHASAPQISLQGATIQDEGGNDASLTMAGTSLATNKAIVIDSSAPVAPVILVPATASVTTNASSLTISGTCVSGATVNLTGSDTQSMTCSASAFSFSVSKSADATYSFALTQTDSNGTSGQASVQWVRDATGPSVSSVTSSSANGTYNTGDSIAIQVIYDEALVLSGAGTPTLLLETGGTDRSATFVSASGSTLNFSYTVQAGDSSADLDTHASAPQITLNGRTLRDAAGNDASLTMAGSSLATNKSLVVSGTLPAPTVSSVSPSTSTNPEEGGDTLTILGTGFAAGATVTLVSGGTTLTCGSPSVNTGTQTITCTTPTPPASGAYDVVVTNTDAQSGSQASAFTYSNFCSAYGSQTPWAGSQETPSKGGDGSSGDPFKVCTYTQFNNMRNFMTAATGKSFKLMADIDVIGQSFTSISTVGTNCGDSSAFIAGSLDGNSKKVSNLTVPLFGSICRGASVKNLTLENPVISMSANNGLGALARGWYPNSVQTIEGVHVVGGSVTNTTGELTGGMIGEAASENPGVGGYVIKNCSSSASVEGVSHVGGLIGRLGSGHTVQDSYATGNVTVSTQNGGGFVGDISAYATGNTVIERCYATGNVGPKASSSASNFGGFVGSTGSGGSLITIRRCFATGSVGSVTKFGAGGFVVNLTANSTIENSYTTSSTASQSGVGGFVQYMTGGTIQKCYGNGPISTTDNNPNSKGGFSHNKSGGTYSGNYWDTELTGLSSATGQGSGTGATGLTTSQMQDSANFSGWDFSTIWQLPTATSGPTTGAPVLRGVTPGY